MKNMDTVRNVRNFIEMGQILFGPDVTIRYEVKNNTVGAVLIFYLSREIEDTEYTAEKQYTMFVTPHGILLTSKEGDIYFRKDNFQSRFDTWANVLDDCPSFKS